jgi:MOSC domain-containing protein YiiM
MEPVRSATLITGVGIDGDKHAQAASLRQVLIVDREVLDAVGVDAGTIKENITVEGLDVMSLPAGTRLQLGPDAVLEITKICEPCFRMDEIRMGLKDELVGRRGMTARVARGGTITVGDPITVEAAEPLAS